MRSCPVCTTADSSVLFSYPLTHGGEQFILCCNFCGMVFSTVSHAADYADESIYSLPGALGSGQSPFDRQRLDGLAWKLAEEFKIPLSTSILDIGCAQGGLLTSLRAKGFTNLYGMDPSTFCVEAVTKKGFTASLGYLGSRHTPAVDLTILSHVLEHVENPREALTFLQSPLLYVEVPNAARYKDYKIPFLDFNSEHINHFSLTHLLDLLEYCDYFPIQAGEREITLTNGSTYPAIFVLATRTQKLRRSIDQYVAQSSKFLQSINDKLESELTGSECILWGAGEYMTFIANLPVFSRVKPVQAIDRNPSLLGKLACGLTVEPPSACRPDLPIVITTLVAVEAITRDARAMGLTNQIVSVK